MLDPAGLLSFALPRRVGEETLHAAFVPQIKDRHDRTRGERARPLGKRRKPAKRPRASRKSVDGKQAADLPSKSAAAGRDAQPDTVTNRGTPAAVATHPSRPPFCRHIAFGYIDRLFCFREGCGSSSVKPCWSAEWSDTLVYVHVRVPARQAVRATGAQRIMMDILIHKINSEDVVPGQTDRTCPGRKAVDERASAWTKCRCRALPQSDLR